MEKVEVSYSYLREVSESVIDFLKTEFWWDENSHLKSSIEEDLGITGDDAVELMEKFAEKYKIDLSEFDFNKFFSPEGSSSANPLLAIVDALLITLFLSKILVAGIFYLFNRALSKKVFKFSFTKLFNTFFDKIWPNNHLESLTVEDLITTAVKGNFTKREKVKFVTIAEGVA